MTIWTAPPRIGLIVTYAPLEVGCEEAPALMARAQEALEALPLTVIPAPTPVFDIPSMLEAAQALAAADLDAVIWLAATWAHDSLALDFLRTCPAPLLAWGVPGIETGSLCGSQQLLSVLAELDRPRAFVHGATDDPAAHREILAFARASAAARRLAKARLGMLGHRTVGMTEVTFHEYDLMEQFGALVHFKGSDFLLAAMDRTDPAEAQAIWQCIKDRCGACRAADDQGINAARCYLAIRRWLDDDRLAGIAIGCYPDLMGLVCLGCGLLAEDGFVTSCEGDMNSLVLTGAMHLFSGRPTHNTDLLFADPAHNTATLSHCGSSALSLAHDQHDIALHPVRLMDHGVVALYPGAPGPVTLANLCGRKGTYRLAYFTGQAVPTGMDFPGIPVKVKLDIPLDDFMRKTADFSAGHHWMIACGDLSGPLAHFARLTRLNTLTA